METEVDGRDDGFGEDNLGEPLGDIIQVVPNCPRGLNFSYCATCETQECLDF